MKGARLTPISVFAALLALTVKGCVLFVPSSGELRTDACDFAGATTSCGACVRARCVGELDACCLDSSCADTLLELDKCASTAGHEACGPFVLPSLLTSGADLRGCVAANCLAACDPPSCSLKDLPQTACNQCVTASCTKEIGECCDDPTGNCDIHIAALRDCVRDPYATTSSCARLAPANFNTPRAGLSLNECVAAHCSDTCPLDGANKCSGIAKSGCVKCCREAFASGFQKSFALDKACACGVCSDVCAKSAYCVDDQADTPQACFECVTPTDFWGTGCHSLAACYVDTDCLDDSVCVSHCYDTAL